MQIKIIATLTAALAISTGCGPAVRETVAPSPPASPENAPIKGPVTGLSVFPRMLTLTEGQVYSDVEATVKHPDGTTDSDVAWSSSDNTYVEVNAKTGVIKAVKMGEATIAASSRKNPSVQANISVVVRPDLSKLAAETQARNSVAAIEPAEATLQVGQSTFFLARRKQGDTNSNVVWSSADLNVAFVEEHTGKVTGISPGETIIKATADARA